GRRNLVQLGRFVVQGVTLADRARGLARCPARRGLSPRARRRPAPLGARTRCAAGPGPLGCPQGDGAPLRHRPHPGGDRGPGRLPRGDAERRTLRSGNGAMKRALVTLGHPDHAGMLRALKVLDDAAPRHGWELRFALAGPHPQVEKEGLAPERVTSLPALRRWRAWPARLTLPLSALRLARLARGADVLYACTLSSFPYCLLAGRLAGVPAVVHVYSSYGSPRPYRKHLLARARHVVAPSADSLALARAALGEF